MLKSSPFISACLVVHNEEPLIERCLKSLQGVVGEIIVVHDGPCTDRTLEIATAYGATIIMAPRTGEGEPLRPLSYEAAQGEWILQIDADEFLSTDLKQRIPHLVKDETVEAYEFLWPLFDGKKYRTKNWPYKRCLFRKAKISFLGLPHYVVQVAGPVKQIPLLLEHRPTYNNFTLTSFRKKWVPWAKIYANLVTKKSQDIKRFNYSKSDLPLAVKIRGAVPWLCIIIDPPLAFLKVLTSGGWRERLYGWRVACLTGLFRLLVDWYIIIYKYNLRKYE